MNSSDVFVAKTNQTGLYNIQSIDNIPSIMKMGLLSNERALRIRHVDIAMKDVQERRNSISIPDGLRLHQYANVYFDPHNPMLSAKRIQNKDICILKFHCSILDIPGVILSDRNASSAYANFYVPTIGLEMINFKLVYAKYWNDDDYFRHVQKKSVKCAEVLVPYVIPYDYVVCAAVVNELAREKLLRTGFDREIFIAPNIFF